MRFSVIISVIISVAAEAFGAASDACTGRTASEVRLGGGRRRSPPCQDLGSISPSAVREKNMSRLPARGCRAGEGGLKGVVRAGRVGVRGERCERGHRST